MFHYWQRGFSDWCLIMTLLLRKAGSRRVQTMSRVYNVFHPWIIDPPAVRGRCSRKVLSLIVSHLIVAFEERGGSPRADMEREC